MNEKPHIVERTENYISVKLNKLYKTKINHKTVILIYHNISSNLEKSNLLSDTITLINFEKQIQFLVDHNFHILSLSKLVEKIQTKKPISENSVVITFDDGYKSTYSIAYPILKKYNIPAVVFLSTQYIGSSTIFPWLKEFHSEKKFNEDLTPMNWKQVYELHKGNFEIGSHTHSHKFLPALNSTGIEKELEISQLKCEEYLGIKPRFASLPYSYPMKHPMWPDFDNVLINALQKNGYDCCCNMNRGYVTHKSNLFFLNRLAVTKYDDENSFYAKLMGQYSWVKFPQYFFQRYIKDYSKF